MLRLFVLIAGLTLGVGGRGALGVTLSSEEQKLASLLVGSSGQKRVKSQMRIDDRLVQVARARAMDMARRNYFDHVNPDGVAANFLVRATGYQLPSHYSTSPRGNNIESIGAGYINANEAWSGWMNSAGHKVHLLASDSFYRDQTSYGVGHFYDPNSRYKHYWVVLTAPPSPVATLSIATPTPGARVTAPSISVSGNVSGNGIFSALEYRLDTPSGPGPWTALPLHSGTTVSKWTANVAGLKPGTNTVRVRTKSATGAVARETTRSVQLVILKPLQVAVEGEGTVTAGFLGTTQRQVGALIAIAALPKAGYILSHWSGLPAALDPFLCAQKFAMEEGLSLTAHFIPDPYPALAAGYAGIITDTSQAHGSTGALFAKIAKGGAFTGALFFAGRRHPLVGRFNSQGNAQVIIPRAGLATLSLLLHIDTSGIDQRISGTVSDGAATLPIDATRAVTATAASQVNLHIAPNADPSTPQGHGYLSCYVAATGLVRMAGVLADGTRVAAASYLAGNTVPIYSPLVGGAGSLAGSVVLDGGLAQGGLAWHKPARAGTRFPAAFDTRHTVLGSAYVPPQDSAPAIAITAGELAIDSPELDSVLVLPFALGEGSRVTYLAVPPAGWRLVVIPRTGRFVGTYAHPGAPVRVFSGLLDQASNTGYGFSLGPAQSAAVSLTP